MSDGRRAPLATALILSITLTVSVFGLLRPEVLGLLRREPGMLAAGQWWRMITPLLVHDGWIPLLSNTVALTLVGVPAEWAWGMFWWMLLYLTGGLTGEIFGYLWQPLGAGNSVAVCGLVGGLAALVLLRGDCLPTVASFFIIYWVTSILGLAIGGVWSFVALIILVGVPLQFLILRTADRGRSASLYSSIVVLVLALILAALRDIHGPPIIMGAGVAAVTLRWRKAMPT